MIRWCLWFLMGCMTLLQGCGYVEGLRGGDEMASKTVMLDPFDEVVVNASVKLVLKNDTVPRIDMEGLAFVISRVEAEQKEGVVVLKSHGLGFRKKQAPELVLYSDNFRKLTVNYPAKMGGSDTLKVDNLSIVINGRGSFSECDFTLKTRHLSLACYGSNVGTHVFKGKAESFNVISEGFTCVDAGHLECRDVEYVQRSVNPGYVFAKSYLGVRMENLGNLYFRGLPQVSVNLQKPSYKVDLGEVIGWSPFD